MDGQKNLHENLAGLEISATRSNAPKSYIPDPRPYVHAWMRVQGANTTYSETNKVLKISSNAGVFRIHQASRHSKYILERVILVLAGLDRAGYQARNASGSFQMSDGDVRAYTVTTEKSLGAIVAMILNSAPLYQGNELLLLAGGVEKKGAWAYLEVAHAVVNGGDKSPCEPLTIEIPRIVESTDVELYLSLNAKAMIYLCDQNTPQEKVAEYLVGAVVPQMSKKLATSLAKAIIGGWGRWTVLNEIFLSTPRPWDVFATYVALVRPRAGYERPTECGIQQI